MNFTTEMLLEWGQVFLQPDTGDFPEFLQETESDILAIGDSLVSELQDGVSDIADQAEWARNILESPAIIGATPEDEEWYKTETAFYILDNMIFMSEGVSHVIRKQDPSLADTLLAQLDEQLGLTSDLIYKYDYSPLRLVPFNDMRQETLVNIAEERWYLFPWHDLLSQEDPGLAELLITYFHQLDTSGKDKSLPPDLARDLPFYLAELDRDTELRKYIRAENALSLSLEKTLDEHWAFRLLDAARSAGHKRLLPEDAELIGIGRIARGILMQKPVIPQEQVALAVTAACFAPEIEADRRVRILLDLERKVKDMTLAGDTETLSFTCADQLKKLAQGLIPSDEVAVSLLDFWFEKIESQTVSDEMTDMEELIEGLFSGEKIIEEDDAKTTGSPIEALLSGIIAASILHKRVKWQLSFEMGDEDEDETLAPLKTGDEEDEMTLYVPGAIRISGERKGDIVTFITSSVTMPEGVAQVSSEALENFLEKLNSGDEEFYCQMIMSQPEGQWRIWPEEPEEMRDLDISVPDDVPDAFLVLADTDEDKLDQSVSVVRGFLEQPDKPVGRLSDTTWIILVE